MGWSGRAPALPATQCRDGLHRHSPTAARCYHSGKELEVEKITALNCEEQGGWLNSRSAKIALFAAVIDHTGSLGD
jgi:hypothetical protein